MITQNTFKSHKHVLREHVRKIYLKPIMIFSYEKGVIMKVGAEQLVNWHNTSAKNS